MNLPQNANNFGVAATSATDRALLRVLRFADKQGVPPGRFVQALSDDAPVDMQARLRMLVRELAAGHALFDAIERVPGLLDPISIAMLRVGEEAKQLPATYDALLADTDVAEIENERPWENAVSDTWRLAVTVLLAIVMISFVALKILPTIEYMFIEFDLSLPSPTELLIRFIPVLSLLAFVGLILVVILLFLRMPEIATLIRRVIRPLTASQRYLPSRVRFLSLLSFAMELDRPLTSVVSALSRNPSAFKRRRLERVHSAIDRGDDPIVALANGGLLKRRELKALQTAGSKSGQAWLLSRMASQHDQRHRLLLYLMARSTSIGVMVVVGGIVIWTALAVMLPLFSLIGALT